MSGEYWNRLAQITKENELRWQAAEADERRRLAAEAERARRQRAGENTQREQARRKEEAEAAKLESVVSQLIPILTDIRIHSPDIINAAHSRISRENRATVALEWGDKLQLTPREEKVVNSNRRPFFFSWEIIVQDYAHIDFRITLGDYYKGGGYIDMQGDPYYKYTSS